MILTRYLMREIFKPTILIITVLVFVFGCYIATRYLEDAVHGMLPGTTVLSLILLRILIALEVLLPSTLYLSVVIAFGRLYRDSEMAAMSACGISTARVLRSVFAASLIVGLIVGCFSLYIRPWAWGRFFALKAQAKAAFDLTRMKGGTFYEIEGGRRVIFADKVDTQTQRASRVFIQTEHEDGLQVIYAQKASQARDAATGKISLVFRDGFLYDFLDSRKEARILHFKDSVLQLRQREAVLPEYKVKAAATGQLAHSERPEEIAEFQWRFINPVSCILLGLLAVPLSRSSPRESKYTKMPFAIAVFAVYSHLSAITKKWVAQGAIGTLPGVWSVQLLLAGLLLVVLWRPHRWFGLSHARPRTLCV